MPVVVTLIRSGFFSAGVSVGNAARIVREASRTRVLSVMPTGARGLGCR